MTNQLNFKYLYFTKKISIYNQNKKAREYDDKHIPISLIQ